MHPDPSFDVPRPGHLSGPGYVPRHRASEQLLSEARRDPIEAFHLSTAPRLSDLPRIRSYDDLGREPVVESLEPERVEPDRVVVNDLPAIRSYDDLAPAPRQRVTPTELTRFQRVFDAAVEGLAITPLLGRRASAWRPGPQTNTLVAGALGAVTAAAVAFSPLTSMALDGSPDQAPFTAHFVGHDGFPVPVSDLTCNDVFAELLAGTTIASGSPTANPPSKVKDLIVLDEQLDEIAALPKGDVAREAIACQGLATYDGKKRSVVSVLTIAGGQGSASTIASKVIKAKTTSKPKKAQESA